MRPLASWLLLLALVSALTSIAPPATAATDTEDHDVVSAMSFGSLVGAETGDEGIQALAFLPNDITVNVGDSVTWSFPTHEPHTLTLLTPGQARPPLSTPATPDHSTFDGTKLVNSGILLNGATYTVNFGGTGDFTFVCLIHGKQSGTIHIQAAGTPRTDDTDDANAFVQIGREEGRQLLGEGAELERQQQRAVRADTDAVTIGSGFVFTTGAGDQSVMIARFLPGTRTIHVGDSIDWTATDPATPHTVTFGPAPANPSAVVNATNNTAMLPTTPPGLTVSSGFLGKPFASQHFSVTFNAPGTYQYYCALHSSLGMVGSIVVVS
jgi:plastocyanin